MESVYTDVHYNLVAECRLGNKNAFEELYHLYAKAMLHTALRIVTNVAEAEDILQDSFLDAHRKLNDFRQDTTFGVWLRQIVINHSLNLLRRRRLICADMEEEQFVNIPDEEQEDEEESLALKFCKVKQAIKRLSPKSRTVMSLYLLEGYDHEEIGYILNITSGHSRLILLRAKRKVIEILGDKKYFRQTI